ncbi:MAG TPA: BCAM0308 family protein [Stellaceae bacterium]|nr:BCAM0308 family protein [Stellaceae bacterium]
MAGSKPSDRSSPDLKAGRRRWGRAQKDRILDPYKSTGKLHEPTVCPQCGAVYQHGQWRWTERPENAETVLCQACHRINDRYPAGIVTLSGPLIVTHKAEIVALARHQEQAERPEHPLNRILSIDEEAPDRLVIATTDIHLPRRIGTAMTHAFKGALTEHFDEGGYFVRVNWSRPE